MMLSGRMAAAALVVAAAGFVFGAPTAVAEESGAFRVLVSLVRDYTTIDHAGGKVTGGAATGTSTVIRSSGEPFAEGAHGLATCVVLVRTSDAGIEIESPCTITDASGDSWFILSRRTAGDMQEGGGGRFDLLGGTGKYAGVSGSCPYDVEYLPDDHLVATSDCTWQR